MFKRTDCSTCVEGFICVLVAFPIPNGILRDVPHCVTTARLGLIERAINQPETTTYDVTTATAKVEDDDWWFTSMVKNVFGKKIFFSNKN